MCNCVSFINVRFIEIMMDWVNQTIPDADPNWKLSELYQSFFVSPMYHWRNLGPLFIDMPDKYIFFLHRYTDMELIN